MAIHEYCQNINHQNYQPLSKLHQIFDSRDILVREQSMAEALPVNMNVDETNHVDNNDKVVIIDNDNDNQTEEESFTYTTHQLMVTKLLSMLNA